MSTAIASLLSPALLRNMVEDRHPEIGPLTELDLMGYCGADEGTFIYRREDVDYLIQPIQHGIHFCGYRIEAYAEDVQCFAAEDDDEWDTH